MNFGLSAKFSAIDFEEVSLSDLVLIGGGCGGGGGGSTSVQTAANQAAAAPGANTSVNVTVQTPHVGGSVDVDFNFGSNGWNVSGRGRVDAGTGQVAVEVNRTSTTSGSSSGRSWFSGVFGFFSWLFGSH